MPLIEIEDRRVRYAVQAGLLAVFVFVGQLLFADGGVAAAIFTAVFSSVLWVAVIALFERRNPNQ